MGTVLQVEIVGVSADVARPLAEQVLAEAKRWDDILTTWRPAGELARLNARAGMGLTPISRELALALRRMLELSRATAGAFDPGVGPLVSLWKLERAPMEPVRATALPITAALGLGEKKGFPQARLSAHAALDAGAVGKGMALDAIAELLENGGVKGAFLDFGGSSQFAFGLDAKGEPWRVVLAGLEPGDIAGTVSLSNASLSTSRASGPGDEAGPIIDPRSRRPVKGPRLATVLAPRAAVAEAWSTALVVLGKTGLEAAQRAGVEALVLDSSGLSLTAGFTLEK